MSVKVNEIKTLFTLDAKGFDKAVKNAEKSVESIKKEFKDVQKQADGLKKALSGIENLEMEIDTKDISKAIKELSKLEDGLDEIGTTADNVLDGLSEGIDLTTFDKLENMLKAMGDIDVVDLESIKRAESMIDKMLSEFKSANLEIEAKLNVDDSELKNLTTEIEVLTNAQGFAKEFDNGLRHWVDNNGSGMSQAADDTHKVLQDILIAIKDKDSNKGFDTDNNKASIDTKEANKNIAKMASEVTKLNKALDNTEKETDETTRATKEYQEALKNMSHLDISKNGFATSDNSNIKGLEKVLSDIKKDLKDTTELQKLFEDSTKYTSQNYAKLSAEADVLKKAINDIGVEYAANERFLEEQIQAIKHYQAEADKLSNNPNSDLERIRMSQKILASAKEQEQSLRKTNRLYEEQETNLKDQYKQYQRVISAIGEATGNQRNFNNELEQSNKATHKMADTLDGVASIYSKMGDMAGGIGLGELSSTLSGISSASSGAGSALTALSGSISSVGTAAASAGPYVAAAVATIAALAAPVMGSVAGFKAMKFALNETIPYYTDFETAISKVAAACNLAGEAYFGLEESFKNGFANQGYTQDVNDYADALMRVKMQLEELVGFDYENTELALEDILTVQSITGYDPNEIVRAARNMSINFGMEVSKALDMMMSAYQKTGDPMNDLLDTMQEYPSQFKKMGVSAEFFYDVITRGSEAGVYNTDKIADTFKELYLRVAEGSGTAKEELLELGYSMQEIEGAAQATDAVAEAFDKVGISVNSFKSALAAGGVEAETAIYSVVDAIANMQDSAEQQNVIAALFGAPGEDVGSYFFEVLAEGEIAIGEFTGSVEQAGAMIESTLSYQFGELQNKMIELRASIGDTFGIVLTEAISNINVEFESIKVAIMNELVPALEMLGFALVDPFLEGEQTASEFVISVIQGVAGMIEGFAYFINVCNGVIAVFRMIGNAIEIVWNLCQLALDSLVALSLGIIQMFGNVITVILDGVINLCNNFDTSCKNMGIAWENFCNGMYNVFGGAASGVQKMFAGMVNKMIEGMNNIPGIDINYRADWGSGFEKKGYKDFIAFDNKSNLTGSFNDYMMKEYAFVEKNFKGNVADLMKDFDDFGDAFNDLGKTFTFDSRFQASLDRLEQIKQEQKVIEKKQDEINKKPTINPNLNGSNTTGKDMINTAKGEAKKLAEEEKKLKEDKKKAQDDFNKALKEDKKLQDEINKALKEQKERQKAIYEEKKRQINLEKQYASDRRKWDEEILSQQVKLKTNKEQALLFEMAALDEIRSKYILTAEDNIRYQQKQFDLALSLRDYYLDAYKKNIQKEIDLVKNRAKEELKIEKSKNDKLIKDKEHQIAAIDALMRENEYNDEQDDLDSEIKSTEEELQKYLYATSFEGIAKREELEKQLRELRLEKERAAKKKEVEDKKQALEDEIDDIKEANEEAEKAAEEKAAEMEKIYNNMFAELEEVLNSGMLDIGKIQELAQTETNATIKNLLNEMVADYQTSLKLIEKYTLNMKDILNWNTNDALGDIATGNATGDKDLVQNGQDTIDKDQNWTPGGSGSTDAARKAAQSKYNALKKEHDNLTQKKNKTTAEKKRLAQIEVEVAKLRNTWGFNGYQDTSSRSVAPANVPKYQLPSFDNSVNPQTRSIDAGMRQNASTTEIVNNNGPLLNIENFNNNSGADARKLAYEMNSNLAIKNRSKGKRK